MSGPTEFAEPGPVLRWTVHPASRAPVRTAALGTLVLVIGPLVAWSTGYFAVGAFAVVALGASLRPWFLPRTYELDARGARETGPLSPARELPWQDVRRVSRSRFGIHLSPIHSDSRVLPDKGLFLRLDGAPRERVTAFVAEHAPCTSDGAASGLQPGGAAS